MPEGVLPPVCGVELTSVADLNESVSRAAADGFAFILAPLVHPRYDRETGADGAEPRSLPFTRSDVLLSENAEWSGRILGRVTPWLDVDSPTDFVRKESAASFVQEVSWAAHLGLTAVMLPTPLRPDRLANFATLTQKALDTLHSSQVWVRVPMEFRGVSDEAGANGRSLSDPWEMWNTLRTLCGHHPNLFVGAAFFVYFSFF